MKWLASTSSRADDASTADSKLASCRVFCALQMEDDWVHVRFLLEALRVEAEGRSEHGNILEYVNGAEKSLMVVFALIRCGSDDPMPWILVVDGLLRALWRSLCKKATSSDPDPLQKRLFKELAIWCHVTAVNALATRLPAASMKGQQIIVWSLQLTLLETPG
jgi:hypothetical protein